MRTSEPRTRARGGPHVERAGGARLRPRGCGGGGVMPRFTSDEQDAETAHAEQQRRRAADTNLVLDGVRVRPEDTLYYRPTAGPEVEATVRTVTHEGLDVVLDGRSIGLGQDALREAEAEGRLRVEPAAGRVGEGEVDG